MFEKEKYQLQYLTLRDSKEFFEHVAEKYKIYELNVHILYGLKYKTFLNSHILKDLRCFNNGYYIKETRSFYISSEVAIKLISKHK